MSGSRRQKKGSANQVKLNPTRRHTKKKSNLYKLFTYWVNHPQYFDDSVQQRLVALAAKGPVDLVKLLKENQDLLMFLLSSFIKVYHKGMTITSVQKPGYQPMNMLTCTSDDDFFSAKSMRSNISSIISGINTESIDFCIHYKEDHLDEVFEGTANRNRTFLPD